MQRWYFVPDYKCVRATQDHLAMELVGDGVKLVGEHELVQADGNASRPAPAGGASAQFTSNFTKKYPELAAKSPVFAQLRNLIDMAVAAAFIQQNDFTARQTGSRTCSTAKRSSQCRRTWPRSKPTRP